MTNPALIQTLHAQIESHLAAGIPVGASRAEQVAYRNKLRQLRMRLARAKGTHTDAEWAAIVAETAGICVRCHYQHDLSREAPMKGYILPVALGGSDAIDNLMPVCKHCAAQRGTERINWLEHWRQHRLTTEAAGG